MSNSVVPAAAAAHAKQLVRNKKLVKRADDRPADDGRQSADGVDDAAQAVQAKEAEQSHTSMSASSISSDFSFAGALSSAAADSAALVETSAQDDGGSVGDDGDGAGGTVLLVGAVGLAGLGVAVLAGGGGNRNEAPDITSGSTATIAENAAITTVVYTTVATDPDGDALTYSLTGTDAAAFSISSTGVVTLKAPADFEAKSSYSFSVVATDPDGLSDTQAVTLTVTNVTGAGDPPAFTSGTTASVAENSPTSTVVYDANVSGTGATFALSGSDASAFTIDADDGEVRFVNSPNFEAKSSYTIDVIATQGGVTSTRTVTVGVTNVTEAPTFSSGTTASIAENTPTTTVVYDANVTGTAATTFALTGADAAAFNINSATGEVTFKQSPNFEAKASYAIGVVASTGGESTTQNVAITVTDVNPEGPAFSSGTTAEIAENSAINTVVYDANVAGTGATTFALTGADADAFNINSTTGVVTLKAPADFETKASYAITVTATDANGTTSQNVAVSITDVDEPDTITFQLDGFGNPLSDTPAAKNAGDGAYIFEEGDGATHVLISNFGEDDVIVLTDADIITRYSFRTGTGSDVTDLIIERQTAGGVQSIIVLDDVLTNTQVFNLSTALASVGHEFITLG